ncbi:hypothetical protein TTHT_0240 [Thermotomaculum hydrothermale]|uniref:Type II secretion system protein n=1 Tax=Thermotomaculum hydrothermale TaxID=981385 RepID=A0A7R6PDQ8_9BACT|nr:type II secretion system protein [Thermotomaculum hydrothermale]BBB31864.1 hypothetical protein TTHT_0240 [Thermotomaculum hydrothermale]
MMSGNNKGYILTATIVMIVILSISMALIAEKWTYVVKREKENELLFRGEQYAQAIRRFYLTHKRYPFELKELIESNPRCIRRLYREPFSKDGKWGLIYLSDLASGKVFKKTNTAEEGNGKQTSNPNPVPVGQIYNKSSQPIITGQIVGVFSKSKDRPYKDFMKGDVYSDWKFIAPVITRNKKIELRRESDEIQRK